MEEEVTSMFREAPTAGFPKGQLSMRRVLAAFFSVVSLVLGVFGVFFSIPWQGLCAVVGIPVVAVVFLMFFTTWGDVASVVGKIKTRETSYRPYDESGA